MSYISLYLNFWKYQNILEYSYFQLAMTPTEISPGSIPAQDGSDLANRPEMQVPTGSLTLYLTFIHHTKN